MADMDDMDDELLTVAGRGSKAAGKKRRKMAEDEDGDGAAAAAGGGGGGASNKRGKQGGGGGNGEGDDYAMDEAESQKLAAMNELEREMYLYEREEQLQRVRQRQSVVDQARGRDEQVEVRASSRRQRAQTGTDSAIGKIAAAHAQREAREKKKKEEEQRQTKQQRARGRKKSADDDADMQLPSDDDEAEESEEEEEASEDDRASDDDEGDDDEAEFGEDEDEEGGLRDAGAGGMGKGTRAEVYDEGAGYEEAEENATLEEINSIRLSRSQLEAWHTEPFFEADLPGCVLRIVPNLGPNAPRTSSPSYMLAKVEGVVQRNSYAFPKPPERTRKWLHLDDLTGTVFRHQMNMVSNSAITEEEYERAKKKAERAGAKFITKGDVQTALERLQHARSFKYDAALVKEMLLKKRAVGKMFGGYTQTRARLTHELLLAQQEGRAEDEVLRIQEELQRLEQQQSKRVEEEEKMLAAAVEADRAQEASGPRVKGSLALAVVNSRNRDKNAFKNLNAAPGSAVAKAAAASLDPSSSANLFSRRHTQSKVYWATGRGKAAAAADADAAEQQQQQQLLQRTASGAAEVELLKGSLKKMDPAQLINHLDLNVDLGSLPQNQLDLLPKRVLGPRWFQTTEKRQQDIVASRKVINLQEWRQRMSL